MKMIGTGLLVLALSLPILAQQPRQGSRLDTNNDGKISRDEWKGKADRFDSLDANHDGFLTQDEVKQGRGRKNVRNMDTNKDGKISQQEWKGKAEMFDRLDADHDGFITKDELKNRVRPNRQR